MDSASLSPTFPAHYDVSSMDTEPPGNLDLAENIKSMYRLLDLISESGSKLKYRIHPMDLTSDDKETMKFNPEHIPKPVISDQRRGKFHLRLCLRVVLYKLIQVAKRLRCFRMIPPGQMSHAGPHTHNKDSQKFHFCEAHCKDCGYSCTLRIGHTQKNNETSHGSKSMTPTCWTIDGPDGTSFELGGHKFASNDERAPMMCDLIHSSTGRHVHIAYCRAADGGSCDGADVQQINDSLTSNPDKPKDEITHARRWRRLGFRDPYSRQKQINVTKCDALCPGPEQSGTPASTGQPSYCAMPTLHDPRNSNNAVNGLGRISNYKHLFKCNSPIVMQHAFHVIFVIDRSCSMSYRDRSPLADGPAIMPSNRLSAVYSAIYSFWSARRAAVMVDQQTSGAHRDAYSVILFNSTITPVLVNDFTSTPDELLNVLRRYKARGGREFSGALQSGQVIMKKNWSRKRTPVMIFVSDAGWSVSDTVIQSLCHSAVRLGNPLSFHSILFGQGSESFYLRKMANVALEIQNNAPYNPRTPPSVPSSFAIAPDTKELGERFLDIAESLRKSRSSPVC